MTESILNTIKKMLGLMVEDAAFDSDVLVFINDAIAKLRQLGVGPETPVFVVDNATLWSDLTANETVLSMSKTFIYLTVKLAFDPPPTSFVLEAMKSILAENTWRLEVEANPYIPEPEVPIDEF